MPKPNGQPTIPELISAARAADAGTFVNFEVFIATHQWHTAKSPRYKKLPHQYVRRKECDAAEFERAVNYLRAHGVERPFMRTSYVYFDCDGWTYWTMGWPPEETEIINRAKL